jgi:hypothetical protein
VFEDRHLIYSGLTGTLAMFACIMSLLGMLGLGTDVRPDSLAALMKSVPPLGSNENPVSIDGYVTMPWALDRTFETAAGTDRDDSEFMITAIVTREGTVSNLAVHSAMSPKAAEDLLGAVSRARYEPARVDGLPVAVNMVWLVTSTTVRANEPAPEAAAAPPAQPAKRSIA